MRSRFSRKGPATSLTCWRHPWFLSPSSLTHVPNRQHSSMAPVVVLGAGGRTGAECVAALEAEKKEVRCGGGAWGSC